MRIPAACIDGWPAILLLGTLFLTGGCAFLEARDETLPEGIPLRLEEARQRWERQRLSDYDVLLSRLCFCYPAGTFTVFVRADTVRAVVSEASGAVLDPEQRRIFPTIDGFFDLVAQAQAGADSLMVLYDPVWGVPTRIVIDWVEHAIDDEIRYEIHGLSVR
ncbi:MAG: hypothetical protein KatS3mg043_1007 [Rhodothermaceae bacterium]|nr:MAG: hypothetical protein KatS3mg043_1007 [Rhodothermaceae bacterium]